MTHIFAGFTVEVAFKVGLVPTDTPMIARGMSRLAVLIALGGISVSLSPIGLAEEKPRIDALGDPLPDRALARLGTARLKFIHSGSIAASSDGTLLAVINRDKSASLYELKTSKELFRVGINDEQVFSVAIQRDKQCLVTGSKTGIHFFSVRTGKLLKSIASNRFSGCLAINPDGSLVACSMRMNNVGPARYAIRLINTKKGEEVHTLSTGDSRITCLEFSTNGKLIAATNATGNLGKKPASQVRIWDCETGQLFQVLKHEAAKSASFSRDSNLIATTSDGLLCVWEVATGRNLLEKKGVGAAAVFGPDNSTIVVSGNNQASLLILTLDGKTKLQLEKPQHRVTTLASCPEANLVVSSGEGELTIWDTSTGKPLHEQVGGRWPLLDLAYSYLDNKIAILDDRGNARIWDLAKHREVAQFPSDSSSRPIPKDVMRIGFVRNDEFLVVSGADIRTYDLLKESKIGARQRGPDSTHAVALPACDTNVAAIANPGKIRFYDIAKQIELVDRAIELPANRFGRVRALAFSSGMDLLACGTDGPKENSELHNLQILDVKSKAVKASLPGHVGLEDAAGTIGVAFSPDAKYVASFGNWAHKDIRIWQILPSRQVFSLVGHDSVRPGEAVIRSVAFSPDGRFLLSGGHDGTVRLWELLTGDEICRLTGHRGNVNAVTWAHRGRTFASCGEDTTVLIWDSLWERRKNIANPEVDKKGLDRAWELLGSFKAAVGYEAIGILFHSAECVRVLESKMRPIAPLDGARLANLLKDLDAAEFKTRNLAYEQLKRIDGRGRIAFEAAIGGRLSLEARKRVESLIRELDSRSLTSSELQQARAIQVLEWLENELSYSLLARLAKGASGAVQTDAARSAIARLSAKSRGG